MARLVSAVCAVLCLASGTAQAATVRLAWDANPETNVTGYRVRYGLTSRNYTVTIDVGNRTTYGIPGLVDGQRYYVAVQAYNSAGLTSPLSAEVNAFAVLDGAPIAANILLGQGSSTAGGGYFAVRGGAEEAFAANAFMRLPWPAYNATGGGVRLAMGDVDGDGLDEVVAGLGRGGNGFVAVLDDAAHGYALLTWLRVGWAAYNTSNGEVFPAVGDIDGDGRAEIVLGLGNGGKGFYQILDDSTRGYRHLAWKQVPWAAYTAGAGPTHPAVGDLDGDGTAEIVVGMGQGSAGFLQVANNAASGYSHRGWIQVAWPNYNADNGTTFPAIGDLDGDGNGEIVVGLGSRSQGWFQIIDDADTGFAHLKWDRVNWAPYHAVNGETHPAVGNFDSDARAEIVIGLGDYPGFGGWFELRDDADNGYRSLGWHNIGWPGFTASGGGLFPAVARRP